MDLIKASLLAFTLLAAFAYPVIAGPWEDGITAFQQRNFETAYRLWLPLAEGGYANAQYRIGVLYNEGRGVPQNDNKAVSWFRKAADQGDARGQTNLGFMYTDGRGVPKDIVKSTKWFRKAALQGDSWAQHYLGLRYKNGHGVPKDPVRAYKWLTLAANQEKEGAADERNKVANKMTSAQIEKAKKISTWVAA